MSVAGGEAVVINRLSLSPGLARSGHNLNGLGQVEAFAVAFLRKHPKFWLLSVAYPLCPAGPEIP